MKINTNTVYLLNKLLNCLNSKFLKVLLSYISPKTYYRLAT